MVDKAGRDPTAGASAGRSEARSPPVRKRRRRRSRRVPWWGLALAAVLPLGAAEVGARVVGPNIERTSGSEERAYIKADQMYRRGRTEVAIVGASETAGGLIPSTMLSAAPRLTGAYNAALSGASLAISAEWTERVVLPALDPKIVVIGLIPGVAIDYRDLGFEVPDDPGPAYRSAFDIIDPGVLGGQGWRLRQHSALIRYRPDLRDPTALFQGLVNTVTGGPEHRERDPGDFRLDFQKETDPVLVAENTQPDGEILDYRNESVPGDDSLAVAAFTVLGREKPYYRDLQRLTTAVEDSGAIAVLAIAPVDRARLVAAGADLSGMDGQRDQLVAWASERGYPVFDRFDTAWPPDHWHDREHVAAPGSRRWSRELGRWLEDACREGQLGDAC